MRDKQQIAFTSSLSLSIYPVLCPIQPSIVFRCVLLKSSYIAPLCPFSAVMWVWWRKAYSLNTLTHTVFKRLRWSCVYIMNPREDFPAVWSTTLSFKLLLPQADCCLKQSIRCKTWTDSEKWKDCCLSSCVFKANWSETSRAACL